MRFNDRGLLPAIIQHAETGEVLTLAYMNAEALQRTLEGPDVWFYSRRRGTLWHKGETSGNYLKVHAAAADCDSDAILVNVLPTGPACHTGEATCFHRAVDGPADEQAVEIGPGVLQELYAVIQDRKQAPVEGSYTNSLFASGRDRIAQKVIEEAGEMAIAGIRGDAARTAEEGADLLYHLLVLLADADIPPEQLWRELRERRR